MISECRDLTVSAVLADPMIRALMAADHVDPRAFEMLLRNKADVVRAAQRGSPTSSRAPVVRDSNWLPRVCFA